jgi:hypothetical protein
MIYYLKLICLYKNTNQQQMHKDSLSSIVTHSYMFRPCWVIFRQKLFVTVTLGLHFIIE